MTDVAIFTESPQLWAWWTCIALLVGDGFSISYALEEAWQVYVAASDLHE